MSQQVFQRGFGISLIAILLAGCDGGGFHSSGNSAIDPDVQLILDLQAAGSAYLNHFDMHNQCPSGWDDLQASGIDGNAVSRLQAAGYAITWNIDLNSGVPMSTTVLAQSLTSTPQLMLDGTFANVSEELLDRARQARTKRSSNSSRSANGTQKRTSTEQQLPKPSRLAAPSNPLEQATYDYLTLYDQWLSLLGSINNISTARRLQSSMRALDSKYDEVADRLIELGLKNGAIDVPPIYAAATNERTNLLRQTDAYLNQLPEIEQINKILTADFSSKGVMGPARVQAKINDALQGVFAEALQQSGSDIRSSSGSQPAPPARVSGTTSFNVGDQAEAYWGSSWYPVSVIATKGDHCLIHYDGYGDNWNEWVPPNRIRPRSGR